MIECIYINQIGDNMKLNDKKRLKSRCRGYYKTVIKILKRSLDFRSRGCTLEILRNIRSGGPEAYIEYYLNDTIPKLHHDYEELWTIETDKRFATAVRSLPLNNALFARRKGKIRGFEELGKVVSPDDLLIHLMTKHTEKFKQLVNKLERRNDDNGK